MSPTSTTSDPDRPGRVAALLGDDALFQTLAIVTLCAALALTAAMAVWLAANTRVAPPPAPAKIALRAE